MSDLGWKLRRLRAMAPAEIIHRAKISLRNKLTPAAYEKWTPAKAFTELFAGTPQEVSGGSLLSKLICSELAHEHFQSVIEEANALLSGKWNFFGRDVQLSDPPNWRMNYWTGLEWPNLPASEIDYHKYDIAGGAKFTWEIGRLTFLPSLALAYRVTGDERYSEQCLEWMLDFTDKNPLGRGIHQTSGIEMSVRVLTCTFALALLGDYLDGRESEIAPIIGLVAQQALHCRDNLSIGSSGNNHLIAEYAAMAMTGATFPSLKDSDNLKHDGHSGLEREILRQFNSDGTNVEQSFGYIPFIWELVLYPLLALEAAGAEISSQVKERLSQSLEFARVIRLPNGKTPQIGDEDDGRILLGSDENPRLDLVGNALAACLNQSALSSSSQELARLLTPSTPAVLRVSPADGNYEFPDGGYTVFRCGGLLVTFDHGPLGWGSLAAHGHSDALSVTIFAGETPIVIDPGIFAYHEDPEARDRFRSTPYHSTVNFAGKNQSEMLGPFLWGRRAIVAKKDNSWECRWIDGELHRRSVSVIENEIIISDDIVGTNPETVFILHPDAQISLTAQTAEITIREVRATFTSEGLQDWRIEPGEYSERIGHKMPTKRLCAHWSGEKSTTRIRIEK